MFRANITRDEATARSHQLRVGSYEVTVDLSGARPDGSPLADAGATFVTSTRLSFSSIACVAHANVIADEIIEARLDGADLSPEAFDGEHLVLELSEGDHVLETVAVMRYSRTGEGLHRFVDPADDRTYLYSQFEVADARRMYTTFEQPDLKATFQLTVLAPQSWTVLSNSPAVSPTPHGEGISRWEFAPTPRISTYITALCAGEFHSVEDVHTREDGSTIPLSIHVRQSLAEHLDADRIIETTRRGFDVFEHHFGRPYPFEDYAQVFVPEFNFGAMENAGCVTFRDDYIFRSRETAATYESRDNTILHEMAHMWFGDLVTMKWWDDLWLNESFAEWASHFAQEEIRNEYGDRANPWATFCNQRKTWAYRQDQLPTTHPIAADMYDLEAVELNFDGITYAKGASALRQLVAFVGRDAFLAGVRAYFEAHAWGNTELGDLLHELQVASDRDLSFFSDQWLQKAGVNTLAADWQLDGDTFARFGIRQWASAEHPTLRRHRLAVGFYNLVDGRLTRTDRVEFDIEGEYTEVGEVVGRQRPDLLLINDDDLTYAKIRLDPRSLATLVENVHLLDDELARALCWGATWDLTRDGEMAVADYVDLVIRGVGVESDLTAVNALLGQARAAIDQYAPRDERTALADRFQVGLAKLLTSAEAGSDHQLSIVRALASAINDEVGAALLTAWLAGQEVPEGLVLDAELRWHLITHLARVGAVGEAEIADEQERDRTASGAERAAGARSALKDADAKAEAWAVATEREIPNETHLQVCARFWQYDQDEVLAPYVDRYLQVVEEIGEQRGRWDATSTTIRQHVLRLLFPMPFADEEFLGRLDTLLAQNPLPDSVRRLVVERRDDAARALHNQSR